MYSKAIKLIPSWLIDIIGSQLAPKVSLLCFLIYKAKCPSALIKPQSQLILIEGRFGLKFGLTVVVLLGKLVNNHLDSPFLN